MQHAFRRQGGRVLLPLQVLQGMQDSRQPSILRPITLPHPKNTSTCPMKCPGTQGEPCQPPLALLLLAGSPGPHGLHRWGGRQRPAAVRPGAPGWRRQTTAGSAALARAVPAAARELLSTTGWGESSETAGACACRLQQSVQVPWKTVRGCGALCGAAALAHAAPAAGRGAECRAPLTCKADWASMEAGSDLQQ